MRPEKTPLQVLNSRLMKGCIWSLLGLAFLIMFAFAGNFPEFADSEGSLLLIGSCLMAVGISYLVVYAFTRKSVLEAARKEESENNPEADC